MMCFLKVESRIIPLQWSIPKLCMLVTKIISSSSILEGPFSISRWFERSLYEGSVSAVLTELSKHPILYREKGIENKMVSPVHGLPIVCKTSLSREHPTLLSIIIHVQLSSQTEIEQGIQKTDITTYTKHVCIT